ncbi:MAG: tetraacyldisaccharide 4'-kinase [Bacteroidetes bacterium]|nr:tetraacyldisaccharide 4'-kinase [Bacteroidota bacterium]
MKYLRWLLFPFSLLYGLVVVIRNWCYDAGMLKSREFGIPVICVGNLEVGGAGKSPMTEYLVALFKDHYNLATLSRGYGRSTQGFLIATAIASATEVGDEPAQFKHKFPDVTVAVCESRVAGIRHLQKEHKPVILDDAFQHRAVKAGFNILLFDYGKLDEPRLLLPAGNFREPFSGRWRADVLVVSKCPASLSHHARTNAIERLEPLPWQNVFFTTIDYLPLRDINGKAASTGIDADTTVFLLTGIANPGPLLSHIKGYTQHVVHHNYPDHHRFSLKNIAKLAGEFEACTSQKKVIVTTEKDEQRLLEHGLETIVGKLPVLVAPIGTRFLDNGRQEFDQLIKKHVREHTANHIIH